MSLMLHEKKEKKAKTLRKRNEKRQIVHEKREEGRKIDVRFINLLPIRANHYTSTKASSLNV